MKIPISFTCYIKGGLSGRISYFGISIMCQKMGTVNLSLYLFLLYEYTLKIFQYLEIINTDNYRCTEFLVASGQYISDAYSCFKFGFSSAPIDGKRSATSEKKLDLLLMNLTNSQCKEGKKYNNGKEKENQTSFIPLMKFSSIILLSLQKLRDIANLDILFGVLFSFRCCC